MANLNIEGTDTVINLLDEIGTAIYDIAAGALYDGAAVVADELSNEMHNNIKYGSKEYVSGNHKRLPNDYERAAMDVAGPTVRRFKRTNNSIKTTIGVTGDGYIMWRNRRVPVIEIVRAINAGTSFMMKQPFIRDTKNKTQNKAKQVIKDEIEQNVSELVRSHDVATSF